MSLSPRLAVLLLLAGSSSSLGAGAGDAWDAPAFSVPAAELAAAARLHKAPADTEVDVLLYEVFHSLDEQGRWSERRRMIYRLLDEDERDAWAVLSSTYEPWYQARPALRARVVSPAGEERWLDGSTIEEAPAHESSSTVFTDSLTLRAPLPGVVAGSIVETEVVLTETQPFFAAGQVRGEPFWLRRAAVFRLVVDTPEATPLLYRARLFPDNEPRIEKEGGRVRRTLEAHELENELDFEVSAPPEVPVYPEVGFATGVSWAAVAAEYARVVEAALAGSDLDDWARAARKGTRDRSAVMERLLARMHAEVRYTGVEFDEASLVPRPPAETLKRGFGDCKDKATLLVGLLRAAGIDAEVAVLRASSGRDIDPDLPGMGHFNHAIVYVPGEPALWIDPTVPEARLGVLPSADAGRLALIASANTRELVSTPLSSAADNRWEITRDIYLADFGNAKVVEQTHATGLVELQLRGGIADRTEEDRRAWARSRAAAYLLTDRVEDIEIAATRDLSVPFRTRFTAVQSGRGVTDLHEAGVGLRFDELLEDLPWTLVDDSDDIREHDFLMPMPHSIEWTYRVHLAPGFVLRRLPESRERALGVMTLAEHYEIQPDGTLRIEVRFDTGKRRLTPAEVVETRRALLALQQDAALLVYFDQIGHRLLGEGKMLEAVAELRKLAQAHPEKGVFRLHLARAFLRAGLGEAARSEAREATRLSPVFPAAWSMLAWVLQHDEIGRRFARGWDREAALAAYRKAIELDSQRKVDQAGLAIVLEYDAQGLQYASTEADLAEAERLYRLVRGEGEVTGFDTNLMVNLARRGRFEELRTFTASLDTLTAKAYQATALAALGRVDDSLTVSRGVADAAQRARLLSTVSQSLLQLRRYQDAARFVRQAALAADKGAEDLNRAILLERLQRYEDRPIDPSKPDAPFWSLARLVLAADASAESLKELMATKYHARIEVEMEEVRAGREQMFGNAKRRSGFDPRLVVDVMEGAVEPSFEGSDEVGYRVLFRPGPLAVGFPGLPNESLFVVREQGTFRLVAGLGEWDDVADWIFDLLEAGELDAARQWLDWSREETELKSGEDPDDQEPFPLLWRRGDAAEPMAMGAAAAALALVPDANPVQTKAPSVLERRKQMLERARRTLEDVLAAGYAGPELGLRIARLRLAERLKRLPEVQSQARTSLGSSPDSPYLHHALAWSLALSGEVERGRESLSAWEARGASAEHRERLQALFEITFGNVASAEPVLRALVARNDAPPWAHAALAWTLLLRGETAEVVEHARLGVKGGETDDSRDFHTLAAALAEISEVVEAQRVLLQSLEARELEVVDSRHAYIVGRIAEAYGLPELARDYYRRVEPPGEDDNPARATRVLAERRLAALEAAPAKFKKRKD